MLATPVGIDRHQTAATSTRHIVIPIRAHDFRRPLFLVHATSGSVMPCERLSHFLDSSLPVYGLQAASSSTAADTTFEGLAKSCVQAICGVQAHGPYRLAGWSIGGLIAYEMAHRLIEDGESVEFIGLIDTRADLGGIQAPIDTCQEAGSVPTQLTVGDLRSLDANVRTLCNVAMRYRPPCIPMRVHLFTAETMPGGDPSCGWKAVLGHRLQIETMEGTHLTMMKEPVVKALAASMSHVLWRIDWHAASKPQDQNRQFIDPRSAADADVAVHGNF